MTAGKPSACAVGGFFVPVAAGWDDAQMSRLQIRRATPEDIEHLKRAGAQAVTLRWCQEILQKQVAVGIERRAHLRRQLAILGPETPRRHAKQSRP